MEVFTLIKADIRKRKGTFFGFMLLSMLITISVMSMLGVSNNYNDAIDKAFKDIDRGVIFGTFHYGDFDDELEKKVLASESVESIEVYDKLLAKEFKCNGKTDGNGFNVLKFTEPLYIYNEAGTEFINENGSYGDTFKLKKGEIYLPYGLKSEYSAKEGDRIQMDFLSGTREFTIRGFVQEPYMGSNVIGYKTVFISDEEFDEVFADCVGLIKDEGDGWAAGKICYVRPSEKANPSPDMMLRELNLETKFDDMALSTITRETSEHYSGMFINVIMAVIFGFAALLLIVFLIIAGHNISTEIDLDYKNLGILKSLGLTSSRMRYVYMIEYLFVELIGINLGVAASIPVERWMSRLFFDMTGILPLKNVPILESIIFGLGLFVVTALYILLFTRRIAKVKPVKAITSGKDDFYFENRLNMPITKRGLGVSLGLRQITAAPKRYISIFIVTTLLIFTVITAELMSGFIKSKNALISMGEPYCELQFAYKEHDSKDRVKVSDVEDIVKKYTDIEGRMYKTHLYLSINGESVLTIIKAYPDEFSSIYEGREVKYDNEIVITDYISKLMDVHIGDTVTIGREKFSEEYVIVGIFQTMSDTGKAISMSLDGLSRLREDPSKKYTVNDLSMYGVVLKDDSKVEEMASEIESKYGDDLKVKGTKFEDMDGDDEFTGGFYAASDGVGFIIYVLTFVFALVTVVMVCAKSFVQERTDIGISKAVGFKVRKIRMQFAARFAILSLLSGAVAIVLARLFSHKVLEMVFSMFGVPHIVLEYGLLAFVIPVAVFMVVYMIFGYLVSRKVKKVSTRELITE